MAQEYIRLDTGSRYFYSSSHTPPGGANMLLVFKSIDHLYYSLFNTSSGTIDTTGSYENYIESSFTSRTRIMPESGEIVVYSIPRKYYGNNLEPNSISITATASIAGVWDGGTIVDDGEGNLITGSYQVGNVVYSHGQLIITSGSFAQYFRQLDSVLNAAPDIAFTGNTDIKTTVYNIKISDYELNHTLNPSAQSGSTTLEYSESKYIQPSGVYADNVTGSAFQPYITTVGLYNDSDQLIAIGKLAQPLPKPADTELTIQIKLDV